MNNSKAPRTPEEVAAAQDEARRAALKRQQIRDEIARLAWEERLALRFGDKKEGAACETAPSDKPECFPNEDTRSLTQEQPIQVDEGVAFGQNARDCITERQAPAENQKPDSCSARPAIEAMRPEPVASQGKSNRELSPAEELANAESDNGQFPDQQKKATSAPKVEAGNPDQDSDSAQILTEIVQGLEIYYDSNRTTFWGKNDRGGWVMLQGPDVRRWLAVEGYRAKARNGENVSEVNRLQTAIQKTCDVDYADSLAGYKLGIYEIAGKRILVKDSPTLIQREPGDWPLLQEIISRMLGPQQQVYLFGWLKIAIQSLYSGKFRVGQALTLAGPKDCGKSLLQNLITRILGGRSTKPHRYMNGDTDFNGDLFGCEHLMIEDEEPSTDIRARRNFGTKIKEITANETHSCHAKYRPAISLSPFWRLSISVNDEPENLMILPPIDESIEDKLIILKAAKHRMPLPTETNEEREFFIETLHAELPHFIDFLLNFEIPVELRSQRYGITHYQHPEILETLGTLAPETKLLDLIERTLFDSAAQGVWEGSAAELERLLTKDSSPVRREALQLFSFPAACGTYLGRLQRVFPQRFKHDHTKKGNRWKIYPPDEGVKGSLGPLEQHAINPEVERVKA
jgi:hypothetical protein